jgi:hypothetical protein
MAGVRFLVASRIYSLLYSVQTVSRVHLASYLVGDRIVLSRLKRPGRQAKHSPPSSAEVKNGVLPPLLHTSSWHTA